VPSMPRLTQGQLQEIPTLHFIYSTTDDLAFDCKRLETMKLAPRQAHRQTYYSLYWVIDGTGVAGIDYCDFPLQPSTLTLLQPGQVFFPRVFTPLRGLAMYFPSDFLSLTSLGGANPFPAGAEARTLAPLAVNSDQATLIQHLMSAVADEFSGNQTGRSAMVYAAVSMLLVTAARLCPVATSAPQSSYPSVVQAYLEMVEQHFRDTLRTSEYASLLGVTPGYLNVLVKGTTGKRASEVLHQRILLEAKRLLRHTDASIAEISSYLAFADTSYFTRFFHRATGLRPTAFRQNTRIKSWNTHEKSREIS
jgi:AraC family transcriptional activator of pobA